MTTERHDADPRDAGLPRTLRVLIGTAALLIIALTVRETAGFFGPVVLAATIAMCAHPLIGRLHARGMPRPLALILTLLAVVVITVVTTYALFWALMNFASMLPRYRVQFGELMVDLRNWALDAGFGSSQVQQLINQIDYGKIVGWVAGLASSVVGLTFTAFVMVFLVGFMIVDSGPFTRGLERARESHREVVEALEQAAADTRTNLIITAIFGLGLAVVITAALWLLGIPEPGVWGVLTFVTNFIPNIGFVIRLIPPTLIGLLEGGFGLALAVAAAISLANVLSENILQPRIAGRSAGLSASVALLSVLFWAWVLGPIGAILALPLTIFAKALLVDAHPESRWVGALLGGEHADEQPVEQLAEEAVEAPPREGA